NAATGSYSSDTASARTSNTNGWANNGTNVLAPGVACWFANNASSNVTITFVGTVPSGTTTNTLLTGFNLVGSVVPTSGDIVTNTLSGLTNYNVGDAVYVFDPVAQAFTEYKSSTRGTSGYHNNWSASGDPVTANDYQGFFYLNSGAAVNWGESYSVSQ